MRRLLVVVVVALAGFAAAFVAFGDAARANCVLEGSADESYTVAFEQPVRAGQLQTVRVTRDGQPVAGAWVCANVTPEGAAGAPATAEGRELDAGRYALPLDLTGAGRWSGVVVVAAGGSDEVSVPVTIEVTATPAPGSPPDPLAIPDDPAALDDAYLLRVVRALFAAETHRLRHQVATRERDEEWHAWLGALYAPQGHPFQISRFDQAAVQWDAHRPAEEVEELTVSGVTRVVTARPDCAFVEVVYRRGAHVRGEPEWAPARVGLAAHHGRAEPARNPTPWWLVGWSTGPDDAAAPGDPCT